MQEFEEKLELNPPGLDVIKFLEESQSDIKDSSQFQRQILEDMTMLGVCYIKAEIERKVVSKQSIKKNEILYLFDIIKALGKVSGKNLILDKFFETLRSLLSWNICKKLISVDNKEEALSEFEF